MKRLKYWLAAMMFAGSIGGTTFVVATPQLAFAACENRILTFPTWFRGLPIDADCNLKLDGDPAQYIWKVVLNIVEIMLQAVGYLSVIYIIYGGFKYITSAGSPDDNAKSRKTIMNAVIGLVISLFSVGIVNIVAGAIR